MCLLEIQPELSPERACLQFYQHLNATNLDGKGLAFEWIDYSHEPELEVEIQRWVKKILIGTQQSLKQIDERLRQTSQNWRLERMTWVDRNLLRLATYELDACRDISAQVIIYEAVELAKRFSTENSPPFIHGILDKIKTELGR